MTPELQELLAWSRSHVMTEAELAAQRESFVRAFRPAGYGMSREQIHARIKEIDEKIAAATCWGAYLTELNEERDELEATLMARPK